MLRIAGNSCVVTRNTVVDTCSAASVRSFERSLPASITIASYFSTRNVVNSRSMESENIVRGCSSESGGPTSRNPDGSRVTKPSNSDWSMRSRFSPTSSSVYCGAAPTCIATSFAVQSTSSSTVCFFRCDSTVAKFTASAVVPTPPLAPRNV